MAQYRSPQQVWRENQALSKQVPEAPSEFNDAMSRFSNALGIGTQTKDLAINLGKDAPIDEGSKYRREQAWGGAGDNTGYLAAAKDLYNGGRLKQAPEASSGFNDLVYRFPKGQGPVSALRSSPNAPGTNPPPNAPGTNPPPNAPGIGTQIKDQVISMGKGALANEGTKYGLEQAGVDAADMGGYLAAAKGLYNGGRVLASEASNKDKARALSRTAEDTVATYFTAGLSDVGWALDKKLLGGGVGKFRTKMDRINPIKVMNNKIMEKSLDFGDSLWGTSKDKDQVSRDAVRSMLQKNKFFGEGKDDYSLDNADGTSFDIGKDGGARLEGDRKYYDIDPTNKNPIQAQAIGAVNPLAYLLTGGNEKLATNFAGYFTNTVTQGAGGEDYAVTNANALDKYKKAGFDTSEKAIAGIDDLVKAGKLDPEKAAAFKGGINTVFGKIPSSDTRGNSVQSNSGRPKKGDGKKQRPKNSYKPPVAAPPQVFAPTTTAPMGTSSTYGDSYAQSLASIYASNQG